MPPESAKTAPREPFSRTRDDDRWLAELAERQHGVVGRRQLLRAGLSEGAIKKRIASGRLHRLHAGVYLVGHRSIGREGRWMAAVLASGSDAVLSHWSAAALWGLRPNSRSRIDVTVPHRSRSSDLVRRHVSTVSADERGVEERVPVTSVPRTILDLAASEPLDVVKILIREMEFKELRDRLSLWDLVERHPGRRGIRKVRHALETLKDEPAGERRSPLEDRFAPFLRHHRLPLPVFNDWIGLDTKRIQVDCHWPAQREVVELDGWQGHKTRTAFREDRARDRRLRAAGYGVTRLTWNQLDDEPERIAADLRTLLAPQYKRP
ncbi:MAG TPA: type IV toxin-antitoxin system AbiEi family antitoxin domain-containing protein [Solirubrobacterales bacterium]|nr:type IV toxin-antitoxin system AbiEi family antitoxin domain-containing protein [Solirubrobacterales bacterium]